MTTKVSLMLAAAVSVSLGSAHAKDFSVLHTFTGGGDGANPYGGLVADSAGNLYGTTWAGGANGEGTVFQVAPNGTTTILYSFTGGSDGGNPEIAPILDKEGNLYGTTFNGGGANDAGVVFKLAPNGTETVLYTFTGGNDGGHSVGGLIADRKGNFYGTTVVGGANNAGVVFKLASNGTETALYSFTDGADGGYPYGSLIRDKSGNLYGTASDAGANGRGVVYKLAPNGTETVLHAFTGSDGQTPDSSLVMDASGNLYGTTPGGGANHDGVVYKLAPDGTTTVLHVFGGTDGANPQAGLIMDKKGNLYGTTNNGGTGSHGAVFKVTPSGHETVLYSFMGGDDGSSPIAGVILKNGFLFGTTYFGVTEGTFGAVYTLKR